MPCIIHSVPKYGVNTCNLGLKLKYFRQPAAFEASELAEVMKQFVAKPSRRTRWLLALLVIGVVVTVAVLMLSAVDLGIHLGDVRRRVGFNFLDARRAANENLATVDYG